MNIFRKIATNKNLTGNYVKVFLYLQSLFYENQEENENSFLKINVEEVANELDLSYRTIYRAIDALEEEGFVETKGKSNIKLFHKQKLNKIKVDADDDEDTDNEELINKIAEKVTEKVVEQILAVKKSKNKKTQTKEENGNIQYNEVIDYLNQKTGSRFNAKGYENQKLIKARFNEGYTLEDFKTVIDYYVEHWKGTEFEKYLRPKTLFNNKFDERLNNAKNGYRIYFEKAENGTNGMKYGVIKQSEEVNNKDDLDLKIKQASLKYPKYVKYLNESKEWLLKKGGFTDEYSYYDVLLSRAWIAMFYLGYPPETVYTTMPDGLYYKLEDNEDIVVIDEKVCLKDGTPVTLEQVLNNKF